MRKTNVRDAGAAAPLIRNFRETDVFAYQGRTAIPAAQFLSEARDLASRLPAAGYVVNLCVDRYRFAVAFAAALLRRQVNLLPPNHTPDLFDRLRLNYPDAYCMVASAVDHGPFAAFRYPGSLGPASDDFEVPIVPVAQVAAIVLTSGSNGDPAPHAKTWGSLVRSVTA